MPSEQKELRTLLEKIKLRDQAALACLYDKTVGRVFGLSMRITANKALSEEVVSDVFMYAWRNIDDYDAHRASPLGWLLMLARSRALDRLRHERHHPTQVLTHGEQANLKDDQTLGPLELSLNEEKVTLVNNAMKILNNKQRQMLSLALYREMSHSAIAECTGEPLGTVKTTLRTAQHILREYLHENQPSKGESYGKI